MECNDTRFLGVDYLTIGRVSSDTKACGIFWGELSERKFRIKWIRDDRWSCMQQTVRKMQYICYKRLPIHRTGSSETTAVETGASNQWFCWLVHQAARYESPQAVCVCAKASPNFWAAALPASPGTITIYLADAFYPKWHTIESRIRQSQEWLGVKGLDQWTNSKITLLTGIWTSNFLITGTVTYWAIYHTQKNPKKLGLKRLTRKSSWVKFYCPPSYVQMHSEMQ